MGNCLSCFDRPSPVQIVRREAVSLSLVYDPDTGRYLGYVSTTTTATGSIHQRFEPELKASPPPSPRSEGSSAYLEPLELEQLREDVANELSTRF